MGFTRKGAGLVAATALAASALTLVPPPSGAATQSSSAAGAAVTNYGFFGQAFGTRVRGGDLPVNSGRTALAVIGCTRETGKTDTNSVANVHVGTLLQADVVESKSRTYRKGASVNVKSTNRIADARIATGAATGLLRIEGIRTNARAWHDARGFHSEADSSVAAVTLAGTPVDISAGGTIDLPLGLGTITVNDRDRSKSRDGASASVTAVRVELDATSSTVVLGHASARIQDGFVTGILGGVGIAARGNVLDDLVRTGDVPRKRLGCLGTNGKWRTNATARANVPDLLRLGAASASVRGDQIDRNNGYAQTRGRVANLKLGANRGLVVKGIVGAANVTKDGGRLVKTAKGTHILSITFNGRDLRIPTVGRPLRVGNLAVLSAPRVKRSKFGISVIALRVELLPGTNTIVDLGLAKASIKPR